MKDLESILEKLKSAGFKITGPRYLIIKYLLENRVHPSPERIYEDLKKQFPTLSQASIYNTLNFLEELGIVKRLGINKNYSNYDIDTSRHHHFKCTICGEIYDLWEGSDVDVDIKILMQDEYKIEDFSLYFFGICPKCREKGGGK